MSEANLPAPHGRLIESAWAEGWSDKRARRAFAPEYDARSMRWQVSYEFGRLEAAKLDVIQRIDG